MPYDAQISVRPVRTYPQMYRVKCLVTGAYLYDDNFTILYDDGGSGVAISNDTCQENGYWCKTNLNNQIVASDSSDYVRGKFAYVRWTGNASGDLFRADVNNGDHCFTCKATHDGVTREFDAGCIKGMCSGILSLLFNAHLLAPVMAPTTVSSNGCTVSWSYSDPDDVDGYVIYFGSGETVTTTATSYTIENSTNELNSTWSVSIRAYQHLIGPATDPITIGK